MPDYQRCYSTTLTASPLSAGNKSKRARFDEIALAVLIHYLFYIVLVIVGDPASYRSTGQHEPVGDCDSVSYINTVSGTVSVCVYTVD